MSSINSAKEMRAFFERLNVEQKHSGMSVVLSLEQQDALVESFESAEVLKVQMKDIDEALSDLSDALNDARDALGSLMK